MGTIWLPFDEWADHLDAPPGHLVAVWREGRRFPVTQPTWSSYVPEYLGPLSVVEVITCRPFRCSNVTAGYDHLVTAFHQGHSL